MRPIEPGWCASLGINRPGSLPGIGAVTRGRERVQGTPGHMHAVAGCHKGYGAQMLVDLRAVVSVTPDGELGRGSPITITSEQPIVAFACHAARRSMQHMSRLANTKGPLELCCTVLTRGARQLVRLAARV